MRSHLLLGVASVLLSACARGQGPGVEGPQAVDLFASYTGTWLIYTPASSKSNDPILGGPSSGAIRSSGAGTAGAGRAGATGAGRVGAGRAAGSRGGYDGGAWSATNRMAKTRPSRMTLTLTRDLFTLQLDDEPPMHVPMGGEEVGIEREGRVIDTTLRWEERKPRLERSIRDGGKVVDLFEVKPSGRLMVIRRFEGITLDQQQLLFVYNREPAQ